MKNLECFKKGDEVQSPEGVDETVVESQCFLITLTTNGKYRLYFSGNKGSFEPSGSLYSTLEVAKKNLSMIQILMGNMEINPEKTIDRMVEMFEKRAARG